MTCGFGSVMGIARDATRARVSAGWTIGSPWTGRCPSPSERGTDGIGLTAPAAGRGRGANRHPPEKVWRSLTDPEIVPLVSTVLASVRRTMLAVGLPAVLADLDDDGKLRRGSRLISPAGGAVQ